MKTLNLESLSKTERAQLKDNIDFVLSYLGVPVRKAVFPSMTPAQFEQELKIAEWKLSASILSAWRAQTTKAIKDATKAIKEAGKNLSMVQAQGIASGMESTLGKEFVELATDKGMIKHIQYAYDMAGMQTATEMMLPYALTFVDEEAKTWLAKDMTYWVGNFYNDHIKQAVVGVVNEYAIEQGQGHWVTGQRLKEVLEGTYGIPPKYLPNSYVRSEAYWHGMAATAVTRATVLGRVETMVAAEVVEYEIISAADSRVCPICHHMNGKIFRMEKAVEIRDQILSSQTPDEVKAARPWPKFSDIKDMDEKALAGADIALPDFHWLCRCDYVAHSFVDYDKPVIVEPEPVKPKSEVPDSIDNLTAKGNGIYQDSTGSQYKFKPAYQKGTTSIEPFRAQVQQVASNLAARLYEPGQYIEVKAMKDASGIMGTLQKLEDVEGDLKSIPWTSLTKEQIKRIQEEHVLDWTIGNFDSHPGNFLKLTDGRILAENKEQAFRYLKDPGSLHMSLDYHPNKTYGEQEPIYNTIYRAWKEGKVDLDPNTVLPAIKRLEAISDDEYSKMVMPYFDSLYKEKKVTLSEYGQLMGKALERKKNVREEYRKFFTEIYQAKHGNKISGVFKFIDELTPSDMIRQPVSAQVLGKVELQKMTTKTLKDLAKAKGIKYFQSFQKDDLVEALDDPDQAGAISLKVKERIKSAKAVRGSEPSLKPQPDKPQEGDVFEDLSIIKPSPYGAAVRKDSAMLEGQQMAIRRIEVNGQAGYQIITKIPEAYHDQVSRALKQEKAKVTRQIEFNRGYADPKSGAYLVKREPPKNAWDLSSDPVKVNANGLVLDQGKIKIQFTADKNMRAIMGHMDIIVMEQDGRKAADEIRGIMDRMGLDKVLKDPTDEDAKILKLSRLLWQNSPGADAKISDRTIDKLEAACRKNGIDPARINKMAEKEVYPGYSTYVENGAAEEYKKAGAEYLFSGIGSDTNTLVKILDPHNPGLMSTIQRYANGIAGNGASESSDIQTGGADNAFVRLVTRGAKGYNFGDSFMGGGIRLHWDVKELERTDWYAYNKDNYGGTGTDRGFNKRLSALDHIKTVNTNYSPSNEVMFRKGVSKENLIAITCDSAAKKAEIIKALRSAGITEVNGQKIENFVKVQTKI